MTNPLNADLMVDKLVVTITSPSPTSFGTCNTTAFQLTANGSAATPFSAASAGHPPTATVDWSGTPSKWVTIGANSPGSYPATFTLVDNGDKQDGCEGMPLTLDFSGSQAYFTDPTSVSLASAQNPALVNGSTTLTTTVAGLDSTGDVNPTDGATSTPDGTATFYQCPGSSACLSMSGGALTNNGGTAVSSPRTLSTSGSASFVPSAYSAPGTFYYQVAYQPAAAHVTDFVPSVSGILTETVNASGNYTVGSGQVLTVGPNVSVGGNLTVSPGGTLNLNGGKVGSNLQSTGTLSVNGGSVGGNLQINGGGPVNIAGVSVGGSLTVQSLSTTSPASSITGTNVSKDLTLQSNGAPLTLTGNSVGGNLSVQSNSNTVTVGSSGGSNRVSGNISVQSNTGGGTMSYNSAGGNCTLQKDTPVIRITGPNTAAKRNACTTSG